MILDTTGAEKLLGRGDMLYLASDAGKPVRIQGTYVSDEEIDALVRFWKNQSNFVEADSKAFVQPDIWPEDLREIEAERTSTESDGDDLFEAALESSARGPYRFDFASATPAPYRLQSGRAFD